MYEMQPRLWASLCHIYVSVILIVCDLGRKICASGDLLCKAFVKYVLSAESLVIETSLKMFE